MAAAKVTDEGFDMGRILGVPLADLDGTLDWGTAYPIVETREAYLRNGEFREYDGPTQVVVGVVDGTAPEAYNGGRWRVVDDSYAVATDEEDE